MKITKRVRNLRKRVELEKRECRDKRVVRIRLLQWYISTHPTVVQGTIGEAGQGFNWMDRVNRQND